MIAGSILYLLLAGQDIGTSAEQILNGLYNSYVLLAVPLFIFAAELMNISKMTDQLLRFCDMLVGRFRGGLGHINIVAEHHLRRHVGLGDRGPAGTGRMSIDMMTRNSRYPVELRGGDHGGLGGDRADHPAVDPDGALRAGVGRVGRLPVPRRRRARPSDGAGPDGHQHHPGAPQDYPVEEPIPLREMAVDHLDAMPGAADAGHSARRHLRRRDDADRSGRGRRRLCVPRRPAVVSQHHGARHLLAVLNSARSTASIGMLIAGSLVFNYVVTIEKIPLTVKGLLAGYDFSATMFLSVVNVILLVLGCLLEGATIILVVLPIFIPTAKALGIDLVHFGVVAVFNIMIGLITPPYGLLLFIISAISGAPLRVIIRDTMPFVVAMIVALAIITFVPETVLWLPRLMGYKG